MNEEAGNTTADVAEKLDSRNCAVVDLQHLTSRLIAFRDARNWRQFHTLKNLIVSLNLEAAELMELTQWSTDEQFDTASTKADVQQQIREECADILNYLLLISAHCDFDLAAAANEKIDHNETRYPVEKSFGKSTKYTQL